MAITKEITKVSVKENMGNKMITLNCKVSDNGVEWANKDFRIDYNKNQDVQEEAEKLRDVMQDFVNTCVAEIATFKANKLDLAVTYLNNNVTI